ncbi:hypothetical protein PENTCL1PPCAC_23070 [Pristionchus entomophagus]|uniref:Uncharacterized protein n=1 Tax=Pristionchus entomophagus TaxID=358040 RepID=A0AAV5U205_9BILA|nr:hypothetical protein PENTCL1PPCAC_23070 [Pristionchus entomophagus]
MRDGRERTVMGECCHERIINEYLKAFSVTSHTDIEVISRRPFVFDGPFPSPFSINTGIQIDSLCSDVHSDREKPIIECLYFIVQFNPSS